MPDRFGIFHCSNKNVNVFRQNEHDLCMIRDERFDVCLFNVCSTAPNTTECSIHTTHLCLSTARVERARLFCFTVADRVVHSMCECERILSRALFHALCIEIRTICAADTRNIIFRCLFFVSKINDYY